MVPMYPRIAPIRLLLRNLASSQVSMLNGASHKSDRITGLN